MVRTYLNPSASGGFPRPVLLAETSDHGALLRHNQAMARLVTAVQELSLARNLDSIREIVRRAAREVTGADGATFVLRDGNQCYYADEDAIGPLWKGQRFPIETCISGWTMLHSEAAIVEDICRDARIPGDVYRPTFVKSLVMVPIREQSPIGAIGNYWASRHRPTAGEVEILKALANTTAVAMENVQLYSSLEARVKERTAELQAANRELEAFSFAVSHDLGAPLRSIRSFAEFLAEEHAAALPEQARDWLERIRTSGAHMHHLLQDLLRLSKVTLVELTRTKVDLTAMAEATANRLASEYPQRKVLFSAEPGLQVQADIGLLQIALDNLLSNAWKYTAYQPQANVTFGCSHQANGCGVFFVRDNGAGFDMANATQLFQPFRRFHSKTEFDGTGVGLATVQRVVQKHGGRIWAEAEPGRGATFYFTIPHGSTNSG